MNKHYTLPSFDWIDNEEHGFSKREAPSTDIQLFSIELSKKKNHQVNETLFFLMLFSSNIELSVFIFVIIHSHLFDIWYTSCWSQDGDSENKCGFLRWLMINLIDCTFTLKQQQPSDQPSFYIVARWGIINHLRWRTILLPHWGRLMVDQSTATFLSVSNAWIGAAGIVNKQQKLSSKTIEFRHKILQHHSSLQERKWTTTVLWTSR